MIILKDAYVFSFNPDHAFGRYSLLINESKINDMADSGEKGKEKLVKWLQQYENIAEVIDCSDKLIIPPVVNSCVKSEGLPIHYLLKHRHYENSEDDLCTDLIFNYLYQESTGGEARSDIENIYRYSFCRMLKSGITMLNEFSLRKDISHFLPAANVLKQTSQQVSLCYPITQDVNTIRDYKYLNPSFYLTQENHLTVYDISNITELKSNYISKLYLEVATNKEITDKFRATFRKSVIALLNEYGLIDETTSLINPLYLNYDDLKIITDKGANIIVCPRDLITFSNKYFPIDDYISHGIRFSIGTGWLGEDIFKDVRLFRNRYKELNLSSIELLNAIMRFPAELYFSGENNGTIDAGNSADMVFIDLGDLRFQFFPESNLFEHVCDFLLDNLTTNNISDVISGGVFKVRDRKIQGVNEEEVITSIAQTRERLYKAGKYEEILRRKQRRLKAEMPGFGARQEDDEIKLFTESTDDAKAEEEVKEDFRIKTKIPVVKRRIQPGQSSLFEDTEQTSIVECDEFKETPELNLLLTEFSDSKTVEEDVVQVKAVDEQILKSLGTQQRKYDKPVKKGDSEGKVELPKNVKLKFGDD